MDSCVDHENEGSECFARVFFADIAPLTGKGVSFNSSLARYPAGVVAGNNSETGSAHTVTDLMQRKNNAKQQRNIVSFLNTSPV